MKKAAKILTIVMTAVLAFGMAGCGSKNKTDIKELQKNKGDMLVIRSFPQECMTEEEYENGIAVMSVLLSKSIEVFNEVCELENLLIL